MNRSYAYLRIIGKSDTAAVTKAFGIQPATSWNVGDKKPNGSAYNFSHWQSAEFERPSLDEAVRALVEFIEGAKIKFSRLPNDFVATIQCVGYHEEQSPGFHFDEGLVQRLGRLGLAIDFDLYCHAKQ